MKIILDGSDAIVGTRAIRRYTINLINEFLINDHGAQYKIFFNYFRGDHEDIYQHIRRNKNFSIIRYPLPRHISLPLLDKLKFPSVDLFTGRADIFHALGDDCPPVRRSAYIITLHGIVYMTRPDLIDPTYARKKKVWLKKMVKKADYFIAVSESTKNEFLGFFNFIAPKQVRVIPLGIGSEFQVIETNLVKGELQRKFNISRPYVLYVGGIEARKNIGGIIHGFSFISSQFKELDLIIVGPQGKYLRKVNDLISELQLYKRIKIFDYISQESDDLPVLYNGAECFVFPSFSEGWASPPLEAMACGIPVVTSNVSSLPETVGGEALMVDPNDHEEIGSAIEKLVSDNDLKQTMKQLGLQHASKFSWKRCAEKTYDFYKYIVESKY